MISKQEQRAEMDYLKSVLYVLNKEIEKLGKVTVGVKMKAKTNSYKVRYENQTPCFDLVVTVEKSEIEEIQAQDPTAQLSESEYSAIKKALKEDICKKVSLAFEKAKGFGADVFNVYELAHKTKYKETTKNYDSPEEFLNNLKLNVEVGEDFLDNEADRVADKLKQVIRTEEDHAKKIIRQVQDAELEVDTRLRVDNLKCYINRTTLLIRVIERIFKDYYRGIATVRSAYKTIERFNNN